MKSKPIEYDPTPDLFRSELRSIINLQHELCQLAELVDWDNHEKTFEKFFESHTGNPAIPTRLIVGLFYLKHTFQLSDEELVARWVENPYWQYFCGEQYLQHEFPIDPSSMSRWRKRFKEKGCEKLLEESIRLGLKTKTIKEKDLKKSIVDTTVQEKAITYPTDAKLYHRGRELLAKLSACHELDLRQTYRFLSKKALFQCHQYFKAKQMKRAKRQVKKLKTYLGRVYRDVQRQLENRQHLKPIFAELLSRVEKVLNQTKTDKNKLYSMHAPEVECIAKGKVHKHYEFGVKVSIATTHRKNFVIGIKALPGNPYDGHTLKDALDQVERLTGKRPEECFVDRGYKKHEEKQAQVYLSRQKQNGLTQALRKAIKRRNAIEPIIGHLKSDHQLNRNYLKGTVGDGMNAIMSGVGYNLRAILRMLRIFWFYIFTICFKKDAEIYCEFSNIIF